MQADNNRYYILNDEGDPIATDCDTWAQWMHDADKSNKRVIQQDRVGCFGKVLVSTVFLGLNHAFDSGPPVLFETMIFEGLHNQEQWRYLTKAEALAGHAHALRVAKGEVQDAH